MNEMLVKPMTTPTANAIGLVGGGGQGQHRRAEAERGEADGADGHVACAGPR